jgi:hypothetical protein
MNAEGHTRLGKLTGSKLLVQCAVLVNIIFNKPDRGRNQPGEENDRKQNKQERGPLTPVAEDGCAAFNRISR